MPWFHQAKVSLVSGAFPSHASSLERATHQAVVAKEKSNEKEKNPKTKKNEKQKPKKKIRRSPKSKKKNMHPCIAFMAYLAEKGFTVVHGTIPNRVVFCMWHVYL